MDTKKIKSALEAKLKELEERAEGIEANLSAAPNPDWEENAKESEDDEVLANLGDVTTDDIRHVKLALSRIKSGDYGICVSCDGKIGTERLQALPYATECIKCA